MPIPSYINTYSEDGLSLLTSMYQGQPVIETFLKAIMAEVQAIEDAAFTLINGRSVDNAIGDALDKLGKIVGITRNGLSDDAFRVSIKIKILVNSSNGLARDLILIVQRATDNTDIKYTEQQPAAWQIETLDITAGLKQLILYLDTAKSSGTHGSLIYSTWINDANTFKWDDTVSPNTYPGMSDSLNPDNSALFTSAANIP